MVLSLRSEPVVKPLPDYPDRTPIGMVAFISVTGFGYFQAQLFHLADIYPYSFGGVTSFHDAASPKNSVIPFDQKFDSASFAR